MKWTGLAGQLAHIGTLVLAVSTFSVMAHAAQLAVLDNPPLVVDPTANSAAGWLLLQFHAECRSVREFDNEPGAGGAD